MYSYEWDSETGGYLLNSTPLKFSKEPRPVYCLELDLLGFNQYWTYSNDNALPIMWAEANNYWYRGRKIGMTHGGSLFTAPKIEVIDSHPEGEGITLLNIDVNAMVEKNAEIMESVTNKTIKWIVKTYEENRLKADIFYVAFSGGKDSIVLLDLVQRALPHDEFKVVFGDTGMEFPDTYRIIEKIECDLKQKKIEFIRASAHYNSITSWKLFGPPSQRIRWCCSVHKTAPQIIEIRKRLKNSNFRGVAFIGVRGDESVSRSEYKMFECGKKHNGQCSAYPILEWNSAEIFLYIFQRNLIMNEAYKTGNSRVGCLVCPLAANKNEFFKFRSYPVQSQAFLNIIRQYNFLEGDDSTKINDYLDYGGWKARSSGSAFDRHEQRYLDSVINGKLIIKVKGAHCDWKKWMPTVGLFESLGCNQYSIDYMGYKAHFVVVDNGDEYEVTIPSHDIYSRATFFKFFKQVFKKAAYCIACGECEANCTNGCISSINGEIQINDCKHCTKCNHIENGCLLYHSQRKPKEAKMDNKSINRYGNLAPQTEWVEAFIKNDGEYERDISLGTNKIKSFRSFLRDAELVVNKTFSNFAKAVKRAGLGNANIGWALILVNLACSPEIGWFIKTLNESSNMARDEFEARAREYGDYKSISKAPTHISQAFVILADTPLGEVGLGKSVMISGKKYFSRSSWSSPDPRVILYAIYKFAEACDGYYQFTLSRLMDFSIDSPGISPAQIFGIDEATLALILRGLSVQYPDYINFSETLGLQTIDLRKANTAADVLELF